MAHVESERLIKAPPEYVFKVVAHIEEFQNINPKITNIEFLTESHAGLGTRFKETRMMKGREATSTLEVTEYEPPSAIRLVSDEGGTIWDTIFTVTPLNQDSVLKMHMEARPYKFMAKLITPLILGMVRKAVDEDMDLIRTHCETQADV